MLNRIVGENKTMRRGIHDFVLHRSTFTANIAVLDWELALCDMWLNGVKKSTCTDNPIPDTWQTLSPSHENTEHMDESRSEKYMNMSDCRNGTSMRALPSFSIDADSQPMHRTALLGQTLSLMRTCSSWSSRPPAGGYVASTLQEGSCEVISAMRSINEPSLPAHARARVSYYLFA